MIVGCVTEIKTEEYRVGLTPESVTALVEAGHTVLIERGAGNGSHYFDEDVELAYVANPPSVYATHVAESQRA